MQARLMFGRTVYIKGALSNAVITLAQSLKIMAAGAPNLTHNLNKWNRYFEIFFDGIQANLATLLSVE
jgi:hypothetical protein